MRASSGVISERILAYAGCPSSSTSTSADRFNNSCPRARRVAAVGTSSSPLVWAGGPNAPNEPSSPVIVPPRGCLLDEVFSSSSPSVRHANSRSSAVVSWSTSTGRSPSSVRSTAVRPARTVAPRVRFTVRHDVVAATRSSPLMPCTRSVFPTTGTTRLAGRFCSSLISHPEDRQVNQAGEDAERAAVHEQQPLVLLDRRTQHLHAIRFAHPTHLTGGEVLDLGSLPVAEARGGEGRRRERTGLARHRRSDVLVLPCADGYPDGRTGEPDGAVHRGFEAVQQHAVGAIRAWTVQQLVADVLQRDDVLGDQPRVSLGDFVL